MSRSLRGLAQTASRALINTQHASGHQQQRCAGDLPCKANKYVESWGTNREHIELTYKFDRDNLWTIAKWVVAFPTLVYIITKAEFHKSDRKFGRKEREFM
ncbi:hypothetical protein COCOBI_05-0840 [Coccomyxa sp. Obi]|nr:hypothetical protein COCOBI_05-0840 [Coccomyxa sp. Obi]